MIGLLLAVTRRDLLMARRRRVEALLPVVFFVVAAGLFPIGVGPEPQTLRQIAAGVVWVCALLASMLSVTQPVSPATTPTARSSRCCCRATPARRDRRRQGRRRTGPSPARRWCSPRR